MSWQPTPLSDHVAMTPLGRMVCLFVDVIERASWLRTLMQIRRLPEVPRV